MTTVAPHAALSPPTTPPRLWISRPSKTSSILTPRVRTLRPAIRRPREPPRETHVPAQRPSPQAEARLSRPHVDARRTDDPEAPPRQGAQAPLSLSARPAVERRYRLSRSKDFDAVYRQGRSVSTRYLTLHWFPRDDDPTASPARPGRAEGGRERRRPQPPQAPAARDLAGARGGVPAGRDYVLAARSGVAEPADTRGHEWLVEQVTEVLGKAAA